MLVNHISFALSLSLTNKSFEMVNTEIIQYYNIAYLPFQKRGYLDETGL